MADEPRNSRIALRRRPRGLPVPDDFALVEAPVPVPHDGEVLTHTTYLSLDPHMRGRMSAGGSCARPVEVGQVMVGGCVSHRSADLAAELRRASPDGIDVYSDHRDRLPEFPRDGSEWIRQGRLRYREDIADGLASAPAAFIGLLQGRNFGKMPVRVAPDPTRPREAGTSSEVRA